MKELRRLAEAATVGIWKASGFDVNSKEHGWATVANTELDYDGMAENAAYIAAANPAAILSLLDRLEKAEKDAERLDWLEASTDMHGFCHSGYGDFRYYAHQQDGCKTARQVIDEAMEASK